MADPAIQATLFNNFFAGKFVDDNGILPHIERKTEPDVSISYVPFTSNLVQQKLNKLKPDKACGPDGISSNLLRGIASHIAHPMSWLFEASFLSNYIPSIWKLAHVTPVFKKGDQTDLGNCGGSRDPASSPSGFNPRQDPTPDYLILLNSELIIV